MKKIYIFTLIIISLGIASCKREATPMCCVLPTSDAELTEHLNSKSYETPDIHAVMGTDTLTFTSAGNDGIFGNDFLLDSLIIKLRYTGVGTYNLATGKAYYYTVLSPTVPRDVNSPVNFYSADDTFNNTLTISSYNQSSGKMTGTFNLRFVNTANNANETLSGAVFRVPVVK